MSIVVSGTDTGSTVTLVPCSFGLTEMEREIVEAFPFARHAVLAGNYLDETGNALAVADGGKTYVFHPLSAKVTDLNWKHLGFTLGQKVVPGADVSIDLRAAENARCLDADCARNLVAGLAISAGGEASHRRVRVVTKHHQAVAAELEAIVHVGQATKAAIDSITAPPNEMTPTALCQTFEALGEHGVDVDVMSHAELSEAGLECILAVGRASRQPSFLARASWRGEPTDTSIVLVGKGITFDSGGLSIKSSDGMMGMKSDMAGAAVVRAVLSSVAKNRLACNVVSLAPIAENMIDGSAIRPGDVIRAHDGRRIEVLNTDYEGRLVLADALSYARATLKPSLVVSIGTLTGGVSAALGDSYAGAFTNSERVRQAAHVAAQKSGEGVWFLPSDETYDVDLQSEVADLRNIGKSRLAAASVCARFLQSFVEPCEWLHLDIAGVTNTYRRRSFPRAASGFGVAFLSEFVRVISDSQKPEVRRVIST